MKKKMDKDEIELWDRYRKSRSKKLRDQLFNIYHPFSKTIAKRYITKHNNSSKFQRLYEDDIYTFAALGLIQAIARYEPDKNDNFKAYSGERIRYNIIDELRKVGYHARLVHNITEINIPVLEQAIRAICGEDADVDFIEAPVPDYTEADVKEWIKTLAKKTILDFRQILIVKLRYVDDLTYGQIAKKLGLSDSRINQIANTEILPILREYYIQNPVPLLH